MNHASRTVTAVFGGLAALAAFEHGVGELQQGSVRPEGVMFPSWPTSPFFRILGGEPAMSLVPNMLVTGILTCLVALALFAVVLRFADHRHAGLTIVAISVALLLVGGGFGPPVLGVIVGLAATRAHSPHRWAVRAPRLRAALASAWPWAIGGGIAAWLLLVPGIPLLSLGLGVESAALVGIAFIGSMSLLALSIVTGYARDALGRSDTATA